MATTQCCCRMARCLWLSKTSKCLSGIYKPFSDAHSSHDTPRRSACYFPLARCPRTRELGSAPSNRRGSAVDDKTPEIDRWGPPCVGITVPHLERLALGAGHRATGDGHRLASHRLSPLLDLEGSARTTGTTSHFPRGPGPDPQDVPGESRVGCTSHPR